MNIKRNLSRRAVGRTGIEVTTIGLGGAWLGHDAVTGKRDKELGATTVLHALDSGINLIDTSPFYGESEEIIGMALKEYFSQGGKRNDFVLSTKTGTRSKPKDYSYAGTIKSVELSLKTLGLEYVDFLLVHDPENLDPVFAANGAVDALLELKAQGTIRAIGLGARPHEMHRMCIESGHFDVSLTFGDYNLLNQSASQTVLPIAAEHGVGVFNAMVVEYGLLTGNDPRDVSKHQRWAMSPAKVERASSLWQWAQTEKLDLLALALQYSTRDPRVSATLVGASNPDQVDLDLDAYLRPIPERIWMELHSNFHLP